MSTDTNIEELITARYEATYRVSAAIVDTISQLPPYPTHGQAKELFQEWCDEEDGEIALTRLASLIVY